MEIDDKDITNHLVMRTTLNGKKVAYACKVCGNMTVFDTPRFLQGFMDHEPILREKHKECQAKLRAE